MARSPINDQIDVLVKRVRDRTRASIIKQCGTMQVLDMTQSLELNDIYVNVNILETISGRRQLDITQFDSQHEQFNRWGLSRNIESRISGLDAHEKYDQLIVLGKPGSGKTTFLKYLAIGCSLGKFQFNKFPIFITIKDLAQAEFPTLLDYITQLMPNSVKSEEIIDLLQHGRAIILLDGLDEISEKAQDILHLIENFYHKYNQNKFVITCRIAGQEYKFKKFKEVEIADFDFQQISTFATKWFAGVDSAQSNKFIQKIQENESIRELANSPLLLTLLCLMFQEAAEFPWNRLELYHEGLNLLLKKWDVKKNVERSQVYKNLSYQQKQDLLSQIALTTFERSEYFFKQSELEQYIAEYISNLHGADTANLKNDSYIVLKSIEAQHGLLVERASGIYSFSHLTFQEYFAARQIATISFEPQVLETSLQKLVSRITENRWWEVFLLTVGMLRNADYMLKLMKQKVDSLVAQEQQVQEFLAWANYKSQTVNIPYKQSAKRAFYVALGTTLLLVSQTDFDTTLVLAGDTLELAFALDPAFVLNRSMAFDLIIDRTLVLVLARAINLKLDLTLANELVCILDICIKLKLVESQLNHAQQCLVLWDSLVDLRSQLPDKEPPFKFEQWWESNGEAWTEQLRTIMINQRQIGYDWKLSDRHKERLRQYDRANQLLLNCLYEDCYVTREVRSHIEETILLPVLQK